MRSVVYAAIWTDLNTDRQDPVSVYTSGSLDPNKPNGGLTDYSYGTYGAYGSTKSDSRGFLYISDPIFEAYWRTIWDDHVTGNQCTGEITNTFYMQDGVIYAITCLQHIQTIQAADYSASVDGVVEETGGTDKLLGNQLLSPGQSISSPSLQYVLTYQDDGNLVLYQSGTAIWAINCWPTCSEGYTPAWHAIMQGDGNFVVYRQDATTMWSSGTAGDNGAVLVLQDDGNLVIRDQTGNALWALFNYQTDDPPSYDCPPNCPQAQYRPQRTLLAGERVVFSANAFGGAGDRDSAVTGHLAETASVNRIAFSTVSVPSLPGIEATVR